MIRVVIDTNIVVSANLSYDGPPATIMDLAAASKDILMCVSGSRPCRIQGSVEPPPLQTYTSAIARTLVVIRKTSLHVKPTRTVSVIKADEPDNRLLECAEAADADYLATGNTKHFPKSYKNTVIVTPKQFLDLVVPHLALTLIAPKLP
jgi:putative PIN family toxin of toxin-antitoxin system